MPFAMFKKTKRKERKRKETIQTHRDINHKPLSAIKMLQNMAGSWLVVSGATVARLSSLRDIK
jgi:hypothetical protein